MEHRTKVAIIGAGSAGLAARREIQKVTDDYLVIDPGPFGTTCARVGCMPSKVFIQIAKDLHRTRYFSGEGILGSEHVSVDSRLVMQHVRSLRDRFVRAVLKDQEEWKFGRMIAARATFMSNSELRLSNGDLVRADAFIIATGSSPYVPDDWKGYQKYFIDTNQFFELEELPKSVGLIGLGVIGLELGQALARLGVNVVAVTQNRGIGGLTDAVVQDHAFEILREEFPIHFGSFEFIGEKGNQIGIRIGGEEHWFERLLIAVGRRPNLDGLGLEHTQIKRDARGVPVFDPETLQTTEKHIYIAGDVNADRPLLHEASDEGRIAAYNAVRDGVSSFSRRLPLSITFSEPNIAIVGRSYRELHESGVEFVVGEVRYKGFGRAIIMLEEKGITRIYADRRSGKILGAEIFAPAGEHLAHLLAWSMSTGANVHDLLSRPFYHPVIEESLRAALRSLASQVEAAKPDLEIPKSRS